MRVLTKNRLRILIIFAVVFLLTSTTLASSTANYQLNWYTVDGGGGNSSGGTFTLSGTIGQGDAGRLNGDTYTLAGGFWATVGKMTLYLPIALK